MSRRLFAALVWGLPALGFALAAHAEREWDAGESWRWDWRAERQRDDRSAHFDRIAMLPNYVNNADATEETVSEIIAATKDGKTLVYTDSPLDQIGFIDITKPHMPVHAGTFALDGEPTSVAVLGNKWVLAGVNTSESPTSPSGYLAVIDTVTRELAARIELGGQPDSVALSPNGRYAAIAIENERDEGVVVNGVEGGLPQLPAGFLAIVDINGWRPADWTLRTVDLTGLAAYGTDDPEPEYVDINEKNEAVVTMQENNHIAIVDLRTGLVKSHFGAGSVDLIGIDATEDGVIALDDTLLGVPREPDAVAWIPQGYGHHAIATANEGDLFGGSRGFTIFGRDGRVDFDSGASLEEAAVRHGHYPEDRSENKGSEPEAIEYGEFDGRDYLFVATERGSFIAVYELDRSGKPGLVQVLSGPLGPEGVLAIPSRNLLVVSAEVDAPPFGVRSSVVIYRLENGRASEPQILSDDDASGKPIPWSALSGLVPAPHRRDELLAVWDSYYSESRILTIDVSKKPARVVDSIPIVGGTGDYDPEGIAVAPDGTYWIASEGNAGSRLNRLLQTDRHGNLLAEIGLPAEIEQCRAASTNRGTLGSGFEGVAAVSRSGWSSRQKGYVLLVAQQRGWDYNTPECEALDDDPDGTNPAEPAQTRIWIYDPEAGAWDYIAYALEPVPQSAAWVGLSEITKVPGGYVVIERDNLTGDFARLKTLVSFGGWSTRDGVVARAEKRVYDLLPDLLATNGWITDKPEGVAITSDGRTYVVTDNDGVEDWSGETWFLRFGDWWQLFESDARHGHGK